MLVQQRNPFVYESKGMDESPHRSENGYRQYGEIYIEQLELQLRARWLASH
ncbi:hypothetical protein OH492_05930 [Vibrio chagasii]|nr:hypothetical protein [Vibrio chagasii]